MGQIYRGQTTMTLIDDQLIAAQQDKIAQRTSTAKRWIWVNFQRAGFHLYPQASSDENLADVSYLGSRHRHLFKFNIQIEIFHNDRELEFHQVLNFCESLFEGKIDIDYKSVEMLADDIYQQLAAKYPGREMKINVSEDGECGCLVEYQ